MESLTNEVSVVIINYNGERYIKDCLRSVFDADIFASPVLLIDNKSDDRSLEIAKKYFPQVEIIELDKNYGPAKARNIGIKRIKTKWALLLDVDTIVTKDWLKALLNEVEGDSEIGIAVSRVLFYENKEMINSEGGGYAHYMGIMVLKNGFCHIDKVKSEVAEIGAAGAISMLVDKEKAIKVSLFDEDFFVYLEDLDFSLRMRLNGYKCLSIPSSVVYHRGGTANISYRGGEKYPEKNAYFHIKNRVILILKLYSLKTLFLCCPAILFYEMAILSIVLKKRLIRPYLEAWLKIFKSLPDIIQKRKDIQRNRKVSDAKLLWAGKMVFHPGLMSGWIERFGKTITEHFLYWYWLLVRRFL
jgi:hypothetical protein